MHGMFIPTLAFLMGLTGTMLAVEPEAFAEDVPSESDEPLIAKMQDVYDGTQWFQTDFVQTFRVGGGKAKKSKGRVIWLRDEGKGRVRFDYKDPDGNFFCTDGSEMLAYQKTENQHFRSKVEKSEHAAALSFLTGIGKLRENFNFSRERKLEESLEKSGKSKGIAILKATPMAADSAYKSITFFVDSPTGEIRRVRVTREDGENFFDFQGRPKFMKDKKGSPAFSCKAPDGSSEIRGEK